MERIHPLTEQAIKPYIGKTVCVVTHDERLYQGYICGVEDGQIILSDQESHANIKSSKNKRRSGTKQKQKAAVNAITPYGIPYNGRIWLDLALIALLITIPFIGFPIFL